MGRELEEVLSAGSMAARAARPLIAGSRVLKAGVVSELSALNRVSLEVQREGEELLRVAREEAERLRFEAREEGRREGLGECLRELARARAEYRRLQDVAEADLVDLALVVAGRLVGQVLERERAVVVRMVREALRGARGRRSIVVRVSAADAPIVEAHRQELVASVEGVPVYVEVDGTLKAGDTVIETESGRIDARLETQLAVLREALTGGRGGS